MNLLVIISCALLVASGVRADVSEDFNVCLDKDSISCIQLTMYRTAKSFFEKPNIDIFGGLSLKKTEESRKGKSIEDNSIAVESAKSVDERNKEIESYFMTNAKNFFQERSLSINFADTARSIAKRIPDELKSDIRDLFVEGRAKKKKIMKKLTLIAYGVLAKIGFLAIGALIFLLFVAKNALLVSVAALGLSLFTGLAGVISRTSGGGGGFLSGLGLGNLFGGGGGSSVSYSGGSGYHSGNIGGGAGWTPYGGGGWGGGGGAGGWDVHGAYSSPVAQTIAYSGHKQT